MCLLVDFEQVFGIDEVENFWEILRQVSPTFYGRPVITATSRITAEMLDWQAGIRVPYVPFLSLHVKSTICPRARRAPLPLLSILAPCRCDLPPSASANRSREASCWEDATAKDCRNDQGHELRRNGSLSCGCNAAAYPKRLAALRLLCDGAPTLYPG